MIYCITIRVNYGWMNDYNLVSWLVLSIYLHLWVLILLQIRMTKDRCWMYGSIESSEFINGVLEFCSIAVEHQVRTGGVDFYCPCVKCGNVSKVFEVFFTVFGTFSHKVVQTWFVFHETWHTTLFAICYCVQMVRIKNNSHMIEITF